MVQSAIELLRNLRRGALADAMQTIQFFPSGVLERRDRVELTGELARGLGVETTAAQRVVERFPQHPCGEVLTVDRECQMAANGLESISRSSRMFSRN